MTTIIDSAVGKAASPDAMLKAAVSGGKTTEAVSAAKAPAAGVAGTGRRIDPRLPGFAGAGLVLGLVLGAGTAILAAPRPDGTGAALAEIRAGLEAHRLEAARVGTASDRLDASLAALKEATDAARNEARTRSAGLADKLGRVEMALLAKVAALGDRMDQAEREQGTRIAALADKRPVAANAPTPAPVAKSEPVQTGSIAEAKAKPAIVDAWAVRDVYDGTAMIEDRRRRLIEVTTGDTIPGIGRVDGVERRGRVWVVVTRQGIVTPQPW